GRDRRSEGTMREAGCSGRGRHMSAPDEDAKNDADAQRLREIGSEVMGRGYLGLVFRDGEPVSCYVIGPPEDPGSYQGDVEMIGTGRTRLEAAEDAVRQVRSREERERS